MTGDDSGTQVILHLPDSRVRALKLCAMADESTPAEWAEQALADCITARMKRLPDRVRFDPVTEDTADASVG